MRTLAIPQPIAGVRCADGSLFDVGAPTPADVPPTWVLGQHLSRIHRFVGATFDPIDVAHHSLRVGVILAAQGHDARTVLGGLLHDTAETVMSDIPSPVKRLLGRAWTDVERRVQAVIAERYGLAIDDLESNAVARADRLACAIEAERSMPHGSDGMGLPPATEAPDRERMIAATRLLGVDPAAHRRAEQRDRVLNARSDQRHAEEWTGAVELMVLALDDDVRWAA